MSDELSNMSVSSTKSIKTHKKSTTSDKKSTISDKNKNPKKINSEKNNYGSNSKSGSIKKKTE